MPADYTEKYVIPFLDFHFYKTGNYRDPKSKDSKIIQAQEIKVPTL